MAKWFISFDILVTLFCVAVIGNLSVDKFIYGIHGSTLFQIMHAYVKTGYGTALAILVTYATTITLAVISPFAYSVIRYFPYSSILKYWKQFSTIGLSIALILLGFAAAVYLTYQDIEEHDTIQSIVS